MLTNRFATLLAIVVASQWMQSASADERPEPSRIVAASVMASPIRYSTKELVSPTCLAISCEFPRLIPTLMKSDRVDLSEVSHYSNFEMKFFEGFARVVIRDKYGFCDKSGRIIIKPRFDSAEDFSGGLATVSNGGRYGYINQTGELVVKPKFEYAHDFSNGIACVQLNDKWGIIDQHGQWKLKPTFASLMPQQDRIYAYSFEKKEGYLDSNFKMISPKPSKSQSFFGRQFGN